MNSLLRYGIPTLGEYLTQALTSDYFIPILISSQTSGKFASMNLPFGLGKTTLALWFSYLLHGLDWDLVFKHLVYYPSQLLQLLEPKKEPDAPKIPCLVWDDVQHTCPSVPGVPVFVRRLAGYLSTNRPECSVLIMTAPNMNAIAAPLRKLIAIEIIVWERGRYEVQRIIYKKNFKAPLNDLIELIFVEGDSANTHFPPLPPEIQDRYDRWRAEQKAQDFSRLVSMAKIYEKGYATVDGQEITEEQVRQAAMLLRTWNKAKKRT